MLKSHTCAAFTALFTHEAAAECCETINDNKYADFLKLGRLIKRTKLQSSLSPSSVWAVVLVAEGSIAAVGSPLEVVGRIPSRR